MPGSHSRPHILEPGYKIVVSSLQDIPCFDMKSDMRRHYSEVNYEYSSLSAYNVVYMELQLKGSSDFNCLSKAVTWTKSLSTRARAWAKDIFFT